jgi:pyridoxamine 5'-phosphate oxidase
MTHYRDLADIRRDYGELVLSETEVKADPIEQFSIWFEDVLKHEPYDPTAMVLSTVDKQNYPDSRVVLLKAIDQGSFVFYTNYCSTKARQIEDNPRVAINFYWPHMARQVRVRGAIGRVSEAVSDSYFSSRPVSSQLGAIASPQSHTIPNREFLERSVNDLIKKHGQSPVVRPEHWGGYRITPGEIEFWQGRDNRLHDRIQYQMQQGHWIFHRLAP